MLQIYGPLVEDTTISFELEAPGVEEFSQRVETTLKTHEWLVMTAGDSLCGYAYGTPHRARAAYQYAVETSVYVNPKFRGQGVGRELYEALFPALEKLGYHNAYAGITMPNDPSIALHKSVGFEPIGVFKEVGFKHDAWRDVSWWQRRLTG